MNNQVKLTDDELSVIITSLTMSLESVNKFIEINGEDKLDFQTKQVYKDMRILFERLNKEYF